MRIAMFCLLIAVALTDASPRRKESAPSSKSPPADASLARTSSAGLQEGDWDTQQWSKTKWLIHIAWFNAMLEANRLTDDQWETKTKEQQKLIYDEWMRAVEKSSGTLSTDPDGPEKVWFKVKLATAILTLNQWNALSDAEKSPLLQQWSKEVADNLERPSSTDNASGGN